MFGYIQFNDVVARRLIDDIVVPSTIEPLMLYDHSKYNSYSSFLAAMCKDTGYNSTYDNVVSKDGSSPSFVTNITIENVSGVVSKYTSGYRTSQKLAKEFAAKHALAYFCPLPDFIDHCSWFKVFMRASKPLEVRADIKWLKVCSFVDDCQKITVHLADSLLNGNFLFKVDAPYNAEISVDVSNW